MVYNQKDWRNLIVYSKKKMGKISWSIVQKCSQNIMVIFKKWTKSHSLHSRIWAKSYGLSSSFIKDFKVMDFSEILSRVSTRLDPLLYLTNPAIIRPVFESEDSLGISWLQYYRYKHQFTCIY